MSAYIEFVPPPPRAAARGVASDAEVRDRMHRERSIELQRQNEECRKQEIIKKMKEEEARREKDAWSADFIAAIAGSKVVRLISIVVGLFVGTYLVSNLMDLLRLIDSPNLVVRIVAMVLSAVLTLGIGVSIWYAYCVFRKLPSFKPEKYVQGDDKMGVVKRLSKNYIAKFPEETWELVKFDKGDVVISSLIQDLKEMNPESNCDKWLEKFEELQENQRKIADAIILDSWKSVGIKTAACPWKSADALIVFVNTTLMVASLAEVYHRRMTKMAAFRYVVKWLGLLYISGRLQDMSESCVDMAGHMAEPLGNLFTTIPLLKQFIGKAAEGGANAYMTYRLGNYAVNEFKALSITSCPNEYC